MPELPEAETIVRGLRRTVPGRVIARTEVLKPDILRQRTTDKTGSEFNDPPKESLLPLNGELAAGTLSVPHGVGFVWATATWEMYWNDPLGGVTEVVTPHGSNVLNDGTNILGIIDDVPRILLALRQPNGLAAVALTTREGVDDWAVDTIVAEDPTGEETCAVPPAFDGQTCDFDFVRYRPLGLVVSQGGDVRAYYAEDHRIGTLVADCVDAPFPMCFWDPMTAELFKLIRRARKAGVGRVMIADPCRPPFTALVERCQARLTGVDCVDLTIKRPVSAWGQVLVVDND